MTRDFENGVLYDFFMSLFAASLVGMMLGLYAFS